MSSPSRYRGSPPLRDPLLDLFNVYTHPVYSELGMSITEFREMIFDFICIRDGTLRPSNAEAALRLANTLAEFVPRGDYLNHAGFIDYFRRIWPILMARLPSELGERPLPSPVEDATLVDQIRELRHAAPSPPGMRRQYSHQGRPSRLDGPTKSPRVEGPREPHKHDDSASLRGEDMDGLKARLERRGLVLKDVDGDGNCYWYALSAQLPECGFDKRNFYHARKRAAFHISEEYLRRVTARLAERGLGSDDTLEVMKSAFTVRPRSLASYLDYLQTTREGGDNADLVAHIFGVSGNYPALLRYLADSDYRPIDEDTARQWFGLHVLTPPAPDGNGTIAAYVRELQFECLNNFEWIDSFYIQQTLADVFDAQITIWSVQAAEPTEFYPLEGSFRTPTRAVLARSQRHFHIVRDMRDMTQEERQALHIGGGRSSRVEMERPEELPLEYDLHYCADAPGIQHLGPLVRYWRAFPDSDARGDALNFWGHDRYHLGRSPLIVAIEAGNVEGVQLLVDTPEVDVNQADSAGKTPLEYAVGAGSLPILTRLLRHPHIDNLGGALALAETRERRDSPATAAWKRDASELIRQRLERGVVPAPPPDAVSRGFFAAAREGDIVRMLTLSQEHEASPFFEGIVNWRNPEEENATPLHVAVMHNQPEAVRIIVTTPGAELSLFDNWGRSPRDIAEELGFAEICDLLELAGAKQHGSPPSEPAWARPQPRSSPGHYSIRRPAPVLRQPSREPRRTEPAPLPPAPVPRPAGPGSQLYDAILAAQRRGGRSGAWGEIETRLGPGGDWGRDRTILHWADLNGNTPLHLLARCCVPSVLDAILALSVGPAATLRLNVANHEGETASDVAQREGRLLLLDKLRLAGGRELKRY